MRLQVAIAIIQSTSQASHESKFHDCYMLFTLQERSGNPPLPHQSASRDTHTRVTVVARDEHASEGILFLSWDRGEERRVIAVLRW